MIRIDDYKKMKQYGRKLGREGICLRAIELCPALEALSYKEIVKLIGHFKVLAHACDAESYWQEKKDIGVENELYKARNWESMPDRIAKPDDDFEELNN